MLHVDPAAPWNEKNMRSDTLLSSGPFLSSLFSKAHRKNIANRFFFTICFCRGVTLLSPLM